MQADLSSDVPIVAILRGIVPERSASVAGVLYRAGLRVIEVPLNSPDPFASIAALRSSLNADCVVGAGTVMTAADVRLAHDAGAQLIVAPNVDVEVIRAGLQLGLEVMPGFATATEAFQAIHAGATSLKLFPAVTYGPQHLKALKAVLPKSVRVLPVGGVGAASIASWLTAGADGFGFGSELFMPTYTLSEIESRAEKLVAALNEARRGSVC